MKPKYQSLASLAEWPSQRARRCARTMVAFVAATVLASTAYAAQQANNAPPTLNHFKAANLKPMLLDQQQMLSALKEIKTPAQAEAYQALLAVYWPTLVLNIQAMHRAIPEAGQVRHRNFRSPQVSDADNIVNQIEKLEPALTEQTARVGILYQPLRAMFIELHRLKHDVISAGAGK